MALPLPPYMSQAEFDEIYASMLAASDVQYYVYIYSHTPMAIQKQTREVYADLEASVYTTPLPTGWSDDEFWEMFTAIEAVAARAAAEYFSKYAPYGLTANFVERSKSFFYDFMTTPPGTLPANTELARASTGWAFNSAGVLTSHTNDLPRWSYDPTTLALQGLLVEPAGTNAIRNGALTGSVNGIVGSGGALPTNWLNGGVLTGVVQTVIGSGTENGINYVEMRFSGTPTTTSFFTLEFESRTQIVAANAQTWAASTFARMTAGSLTNLPVLSYMAEMTSAGAAVTSGNSAIVPTSAALRTQRYDFVRALNGGGTVARVSNGLRFNTTASAAIDLTLRIGLPQMVQAPAATSPVVSTGAAVTRAVDALNVGAQAGTYDISIVRQSGTTNLPDVVLAVANYVVPTDPSPLRQVNLTPG